MHKYWMILNNRGDAEFRKAHLKVLFSRFNSVTTAFILWVWLTKESCYYLLDLNLLFTMRWDFESAALSNKKGRECSSGACGAVCSNDKNSGNGKNHFNQTNEIMFLWQLMLLYLVYWWKKKKKAPLVGILADSSLQTSFILGMLISFCLVQVLRQQFYRMKGRTLTHQFQNITFLLL